MFSTDFPQGHVSIEEVSSPPSIAATGQWSHSKSCHCVSGLVTYCLKTVQGDSVTLVVAYLVWVDIDLDVPPSC